MKLTPKYLFYLIGILTLSFPSVRAQNIYTAVGGGTTCANFGDGGYAYLAKTCSPHGMTSDALGNVYFCDLGNYCVRKISTSGIITTIAGIGTSGWSGDGGLATSAQLAGPTAITIDALGNTFITDVGCHCIRKINSSGTITTIAGVGGPTYSGDGGSASSAGLHTPSGVAVDALGNVYISDWGNSCIRKINTSGTITTIAGTPTMPGFSGDGGLATSAQLSYPYGIAFDAAGNLFIADKTNSRIRKIDVSGTITTVAGTTIPGYNGDGISATTAKISAPEGVKLDASGNLYFVEAGGQRVRKVNTSGIISTIAGIGPPSGYSGDGGLATLAQFYQPNDMTFDSAGNIYISDPGSNSIRIICNTNCLAGINEIENKNNFLIYPNPVTNTLFISSVINEFENSEIEITNTLGQSVLKLNYKNEIDVSKLSSGYYVLKITNSNKQQYYSKFIKE